LSVAGSGVVTGSKVWPSGAREWTRPAVPIPDHGGRNAHSAHVQGRSKGRPRSLPGMRSDRRPSGGSAAEGCVRTSPCGRFTHHPHSSGPGARWRMPGAG
jgi:hypothetical protein